MKRGRRIAVYAAGAVMGIALGCGIGLFASASTGENGAELIPRSGIEAEWASVTAASALEFPEGKGFSENAPAFFDASGSKGMELYEASLFQSLATQAWHCAWLEEAMEAPVSARGADREVATNLARFNDLLPELSAKDYALYREDLVEVAADEGTTPEALEYANDCGGF